MSALQTQSRTCAAAEPEMGCDVNKFQAKTTASQTETKHRQIGPEKSGSACGVEGERLRSPTRILPIGRGRPVRPAGWPGSGKRPPQPSEDNRHCQYHFEGRNVLTMSRCPLLIDVDHARFLEAKAFPHQALHLLERLREARADRNRDDSARRPSPFERRTHPLDADSPPLAA